ncbi:GIY-YIG nuclease family protein [Patescibacteria group bacterium]|nr:GIY-YIG nuclease family protein [Patescibacteria group bacterium]
MSRKYYTYILTNYTNSVLYTGVTNNLKRRVYEHKQKVNKGFTKRYNVWKLVYYEIYNSPIEAIKREKQIKNLLRRKKIELIKAKNPSFEELQID